MTKRLLTSKISVWDWWLLIPIFFVMYVVFHVFAYFFFYILNKKLSYKLKLVFQTTGYVLIAFLMIISLLSFL